MEWTKIPIDLLQSRKSDKEILAITKYQLLWAMLERMPEDNVALRYMTLKQLQQARDYITSIECRVNADIKMVESSRKRQKIFYMKNQEFIKSSNAKTNANSNDNSNAKTNTTDKIREDKIRLEEKYKKEFEEFWKEYPKQRAGSKEKAYKSYCKAIDSKKITTEKLNEVVKRYAVSDEVKKGFAKGCAAWLNDDRFNDEKLSPFVGVKDGWYYCSDGSRVEL